MPADRNEGIERVPVSRRSDRASSEEVAGTDEAAKQSLRSEVKEALRSVLNDPGAAAAAKASAARTLMEHFAEDEDRPHRRSTEMTAGELDEEIARLTAGKT